MKDVMPFLWSHLQPLKWYFIATLTLCLIGSLCEGFLPYFIKLLVDGIDQAATPQDALPELIGILAVLVLMRLVLVVAWYGYYRVRAVGAPKLRHAIRDTLVQRLNTYPYPYFTNTLSGKISQNITVAAESGAEITELVDGEISYNVFRCLASAFALCLANVLMGVAFFAWMIVHIFVIYRLGMLAEARSARYTGARSTLTGYLVDKYTNILTVSLFAHKTHEADATRRAADAEASTLGDCIRFSGVSTAVGATMNTCMMLFLTGWGIFLWYHGHISNGSLVMALAVSISLLGVAGQISRDYIRLSEQVGHMKNALGELGALTPHPNPTPANTPLALHRGHLVLDRVGFGYAPDTPVFHNLTLDIKPGEKVGLLGHSGAGKSTLVNLLLKFYDPQAGTITLDGQDLAGISTDSLRRHIAVIPQDTSLFHRSLMENIRYGRLEASDAEVMDAAKKAHAHDFITGFPDGYNTLVGERGVKLSGGQRQRIAIARAILKNAPVLILDEATSALDSVSEKYIQDSLHTLMQGKTVIAIAHRLSTIAHLDRLIVLDNGQIVEDGTHAQLLAQKGRYASLWAMQSGGFLREA